MGLPRVYNLSTSPDAELCPIWNSDNGETVVHGTIEKVSQSTSNQAPKIQTFQIDKDANEGVVAYEMVADQTKYATFTADNVTWDQSDVVARVSEKGEWFSATYPFDANAVRRCSTEREESRETFCYP